MLGHVVKMRTVMGQMKIVTTSLQILQSSQVTFIYIALFTVQSVSRQIYSDNMKIKTVCF